MSVVLLLEYVIPILLLLWFIPFTKKKTKAHHQQLKKQILFLFKEGEKLTALEVSERLQERTAGRQDIPQVIMYTLLDSLVEEGNLLKEIDTMFFEGMQLTRSRYLLPHENNG